LQTRCDAIQLIYGLQDISKTLEKDEEKKKRDWKNIMFLLSDDEAELMARGWKRKQQTEAILHSFIPFSIIIIIITTTTLVPSSVVSLSSSKSEFKLLYYFHFTQLRSLLCIYIPCYMHTTMFCVVFCFVFLFSHPLSGHISRFLCI
jgi:hypothetical protein